MVLCRNHRFADAFQQDYLADPCNCPLQQPGLLKGEPEPEQLDLPAFFKQVLPTWTSAAGHSALFPFRLPQHALLCTLHISKSSRAPYWSVCFSKLSWHTAGIFMAGSLRHCLCTSWHRLSAAFQAPAPPHDEGHHCIAGV